LPARSKQASQRNFRSLKPWPNPTTLIYNGRVVKNYNATNSLEHFGSKNYFSLMWKRSSLLQMNYLDHLNHLDKEPILRLLNLHLQRQL
jgi:hypothetical protein